MEEQNIRQIVQEAIRNFFEEESGFATTDLSGVGSGDSIGDTVTDPSYVYRPKIGTVQQRPYPSLLGQEAPKKVRRLKMKQLTD